MFLRENSDEIIQSLTLLKLFFVRITLFFVQVKCYDIFNALLFEIFIVK